MSGGYTAHMAEPATSAPSPVCGSDDPRLRTFGLLLEAYHQVARGLDAALQRSDGISLQTFEVLLRIARAPDGRLTMSELAGEVALSTGGVTRLADRLAEEGLVERRSCPTDRRRVHLVLTDEGSDVLARAMEHHLVALDERVGSRIDPADLPAFERALDALRRPGT
jgi:MarR family 2-MHQ and catechol resistance regulon transcriptional repressor